MMAAMAAMTQIVSMTMLMMAAVAAMMQIVPLAMDVENEERKLSTVRELCGWLVSMKSVSTIIRNYFKLVLIIVQNQLAVISDNC